jgi:acetyl esterase/lipase
VSLQNYLLSAFLDWQKRASLKLTPQHRLRRGRRALALDRSKVPAAVTVRADQIAGVPVEWVIPKNCSTAAQAAVCVYFHGGGFVMGSLNSHRDMAASLAQRATMKVLMVDYRLAPEYPFPAALDDAQALYAGLLAGGMRASRIVIGGDSAGGNLALRTVQALRDLGRPLPRALFLFSPWIDLSHQSASIRNNAATDVMLSQQVLDEFRALYAPEYDFRDERLSPLLGKTHGLPPCLIIASEVEILWDDAVRLHQAILAQNGQSELAHWPKTPHAFPVMARVLPEARAALDLTAKFMQKNLLDSTTPGGV